MNIILNLLESADLTGTELDDVVSKCGIDIARELLDNHPKQNIYIPQIFYIDPLAERYIRQQFQEGKVNVKRLARQFSVSESAMRNRIKLIYAGKRGAR